MSDVSDRITDGLRWLAGEFSATRDEFRAALQPDGAALLEGCQSLGYVHGPRDRIAVSAAGRRRLAAVSDDEGQ